MQRRYHVILNARSGTADSKGVTSESLQQAFEAQGHIVEVDHDCDAPLNDRVQRAKKSNADVIVAAGGDGTVNAVASAVVGTEQTLAILPLGTANMMARDLGLPLGHEEVLAALGEMQPRKIDVGEVNGRVFMHGVTIGVFPSIAVAREEMRGKTDLGSRWTFARYFFNRLSQAKRIAAEITPRNGDPRIVRASAIAVTNNDFEAGFGRIFARDTLDGGTLSLFVLSQLRVRDFLRLSAEMVLGNWREDQAIEIENVEAVNIRMQRRRIKAMIDGEVETLVTPLRFRVRPGALSVLAPVPKEEEVKHDAKDDPADQREFVVGI